LANNPSGVIHHSVAKPVSSVAGHSLHHAGHQAPAVPTPGHVPTLHRHSLPGATGASHPIIGGHHHSLPAGGLTNGGAGHHHPMIGHHVVGQGAGTVGPHPIVGGGFGHHGAVGPIGNGHHWGLGQGIYANSWRNHWNNHLCNYHHRGWYHGSWYRPWFGIGFGVSPWFLGFNSWTYRSWGYGPAYYNPYYAIPVSGVTYACNYGQPLSVSTSLVPSEGSSADPTVSGTTATSPEEQIGFDQFDAARQQFAAGDYAKALESVDQAISHLPNDPMVQEFRALTLFAMGRYTESATVLNALLASAPGMDWNTMSGLYGNQAAYAAQLRSLEDYVRSHAAEGASRFVLAYHYLVLGHNDESLAQFRKVAEIQPDDVIARRMVETLAAAKSNTEGAGPKPEIEVDVPSALSTDLVGSWKASSGRTSVELIIKDDSSFIWRSTTEGETPKELKGTLSASDSAMALNSEKEGVLAGNVTSQGADRFVFRSTALAPSDPGLVFERAK
jgi:hypothetical protein